VSSDRKKKPSQAKAHWKRNYVWDGVEKDKCPEGRIMHFSNIPPGRITNGLILGNFLLEDHFDYTVIAVGILGLSLFCVPFRGKHS
jgi:hypothetical protein